MKSVRIGAGQGFYGDTPDGALAVARQGDVRYICCDALAELTLAILQKDLLRQPNGGFARDLPDFMRTLLPSCAENGITLITNAGGVNPAGAALAVAAVARELGLDHLKIGCVTGDNLTDRLDSLGDQGETFRHLDTAADFNEVRSRVVFSVAYLGAQPLVRALEAGANVIVTGRVADASLFLAPMMWELGWREDQWDQLASGVVLGHLMECSGQATGGNFSGDWQSIPELDRIGYPVCEMFEDGGAVLTKPPDTGGRVSFDTVKQQLLYEVLDPRRYLNPDVIADFTSVQLTEMDDDQVRISGVRGRPRPEMLKVICGYLDGWAATATLGYSWPDALAKAEHTAELIHRMAERAGLDLSECVTEYVGVNSLHGPAAPLPNAADLNEVMLRMSARFESEDDAKRFARLPTPLALNGPPFIGGAAAPQPPRALLGVWPTLIGRDKVEAKVSVSAAADIA